MFIHSEKMFTMAAEVATRLVTYADQENRTIVSVIEDFLGAFAMVYREIKDKAGEQS